MDRQDAIKKIKTEESCLSYLEKSKSGMYKCPFCGSGDGKNKTGAVKYYKETNTVCCFGGCGQKSYDVISLYEQKENCDFNEAIKQLADKLHITIDKGASQPERKQETPKKATPAPATVKTDFTEYYKSCRAAINNAKAIEYLNSRAISQETAQAFFIGYDENKQRLVIPASRYFYLARDITGNSKLRYENPKGASIELFNINALYTDGKEPVYITEGVFDALAFIECGAQAIALNSTSNKDKLVNTLKEKRTAHPLIIALDNDSTGAKAQNSLIEQLKELDLTIINADVKTLYLGFKDAGEAIAADKAQFEKQIQTAENRITRPDNVRDFILTELQDRITEYRQGENIKTGFSNLDEKAGSVHAGLYVIGAISSLGKTTFMHQIADQLAEQGQHVLFFSLEQSTLELVSKSLARKTAQLDYENAVNSLAIRYGKKTPLLARAKQEYIQSVGDRLNIIEGNFNCNIDFIREKIRTYIDFNNTRPVIIIDYLQIMPAMQQYRNDNTKNVIDANITELKKISRSFSVPVFVISSINRTNYLNQIDFTSFKESGAIEYTADVVWGLQLACITHNEVFKTDSKTKINEKREVIRKEKVKLPRDIELVCLKNRYGISDYTTSFKYYPNYDLFIPNGEFRPLDQGDTTPFGNNVITI